MSGSRAGTLTANGICGPNEKGIFSTFFCFTGGQTYQMSGAQRTAVNKSIDYRESFHKTISTHDCIPKNSVVMIDNERIKTIAKLSRIATLKDNWNGEGATPFSSTLISLVWQIITQLNIQPEVFPTAADSIQLEYEKDDGSYLEFEICEDQKAEVFSIDAQGNEIYEEITVDLDVINEMVAQFYG